MAKDKRARGSVTKQQFILRSGAAAAVLILVIVVLLVVIIQPPGEPVDGPVVPPVTTTTAPMITTTTGSTPTDITTTVPTDEMTTTSSPSVENGSWELELVNSWNELTQEQANDESYLVYAENGEYVDERILEPLQAMLEAGADYGLYVTSGYRSYETQESLYSNKVDRVLAAEGCSYDEALERAATVVARPGTSEHHTGLAVDLLHNECWELEEYWEDSDAFDWMMAHCAEYGFILRYPKEKQDITGVIYEPWHYRYVGVEAATDIMSRGITLEEYLAEQGSY